MTNSIVTGGSGAAHGGAADRVGRLDHRVQPALSATSPGLSHTKFFKSVCKSIPTQIRQLILYISNSKGEVDGFVGELTSAKRL